MLSATAANFKLIVEAETIGRLQGLKSASCSFRRCAFQAKVSLAELVLWISQDEGASFLAFFVEEFSSGFDLRILQVSISMGTKFQHNRHGALLSASEFAEGSRCLSALIRANCQGEIGLGLHLLA